LTGLTLFVRLFRQPAQLEAKHFAKVPPPKIIARFGSGAPRRWLSLLRRED
jgi:hypothetical protein